MKHILTIILCTASCFCYGQERRQTESREGWWNDNPSFVVPIREIGVTGTPSDEGDRRAENPARHARAP